MSEAAKRKEEMEGVSVGAGEARGAQRGAAWERAADSHGGALCNLRRPWVSYRAGCTFLSGLPRGLLDVSDSCLLVSVCSLTINSFTDGGT